MSFYKEGHYFVSWREAKREGSVDAEDADSTYLEKALPEDVYCETLGRLGYRGPGEGPHDDLCLVRWPEGAAEPPGLRAIPKGLENLLRAGRVYKPALAIANEVGGWVASGDPTKTEAEAVEKFTRILRYELEYQRERPFFLAKALQPCHIGYRFPGDYVWIIDYDPNREEQILWVTSDYELYSDAVTDFDVDVAYLAERFAVRPKLGV